ncbi:hypothetical protein OIU77_008048 [Salix suchowensis]|uniref:Uncharacterized protein n=1 Tax=Salix suchowensis TaxID=1278906 RepID=A0ABQ9AIC5_9ROSI|nr:hypothetical protein OIU77_008048 [Salix suchowensis]
MNSLQGADIKEFSPESSEVAPDFSDENKSLSFWGPRSTGKRDAREHGVAPRDEKLIHSPSSKSTHNGRHGLKPVKVEVVFYALFFYTSRMVINDLKNNIIVIMLGV